MFVDFKNISLFFVSVVARSKFALPRVWTSEKYVLIANCLALSHDDSFLTEIKNFSQVRLGVQYLVTRVDIRMWKNPQMNFKIRWTPGVCIQYELRNEKRDRIEEWAVVDYRSGTRLFTFYADHFLSNFIQFIINRRLNKRGSQQQIPRSVDWWAPAVKNGIQNLFSRVGN